jgi:hypothetical protein
MMSIDRFPGTTNSRMNKNRKGVWKGRRSPTAATRLPARRTPLLNRRAPRGRLAENGARPAPQGAQAPLPPDRPARLLLLPLPPPPSSRTRRLRIHEGFGRRFARGGADGRARGSGRGEVARGGRAAAARIRDRRDGVLFLLFYVIFFLFCGGLASYSGLRGEA